MACLLLPISLVFRLLSVLRRAAYRHGLLPTTRLPVPVVVVGNITVGGITFVAGVVRIDGFESYAFAFKDVVSLFGLGGDDVFDINSISAPPNADNTGGLATINVFGGPPGASDTLIVNGVAGTADELELTPFSQGSGRVDSDGGPPL